MLILTNITDILKVAKAIDVFYLFAYRNAYFDGFTFHSRKVFLFASLTFAHELFLNSERSGEFYNCFGDKAPRFFSDVCKIELNRVEVAELLSLSKLGGVIIRY